MKKVRTVTEYAPFLYHYSNLSITPQIHDLQGCSLLSPMHFAVYMGWLGFYHWTRSPHYSFTITDALVSNGFCRMASEKRYG